MSQVKGTNLSNLETQQTVTYTTNSYVNQPQTSYTTTSYTQGQPVTYSTTQGII